MKIIINGKPLLRKITGVERYAVEIIKELDSMIEYHEMEIVFPNDVDLKELFFLKNLKIVQIKNCNNKFIWEQFFLMKYARKNKGIIINFDFSTPVLYPGVSTIHDLSFKVNPNFFNNNFKQKIIRRKLLIYSWIIINLTENYIFTVSNFQKKEILEHYNINSERIIVASNAWQHMNNILADSKIIDYNKIGGDFCFSLSSNTPNKNFKWIYEVAKQNPNHKFVIAGGNSSISNESLKSIDNIIFLGYLSDEEIKSLYMNCKCFIFPSFYEGFGVPPLEALSCGAKIIVSNTSCMSEVYGKSAYYIDPYVYDLDLNQLLKLNSVEDANKTLNKYSWENTAKIWLEILRKIEKKERTSIKKACI